MRDILAEIINKEISGDQADDILEDMMGKFHSGEVEGEVNLLLGMDNFEWTAMCHALDLEVLAKWRKIGWPTECSYCHLPLNYKEYGWTIQDDRIHCLQCL